MPTITTRAGTESFYKDWGSGEPTVLSDGWPRSADGWDTQMLLLLDRGYRVHLGEFPVFVALVDGRPNFEPPHSGLGRPRA